MVCKNVTTIHLCVWLSVDKVVFFYILYVNAYQCVTDVCACFVLYFMRWWKLLANSDNLFTQYVEIQLLWCETFQTGLSHKHTFTHMVSILIKEIKVLLQLFLSWLCSLPKFYWKHVLLLREYCLPSWRRCGCAIVFICSSSALYVLRCVESRIR